VLTYSEHPPPPRLQPFVRCAWRLRDDAPGPHGAEPVVPDGCVEVVLNFGHRFRRHAPEGSELQPRALIAGQLTRAITIEPTGTVDLLGIRFHPWGAAAFLGVSGDELRDRMLELDDLPALARTVSRVDDARDESERLPLLWSALIERQRDASSVDARVPALTGLVATGGARTVPDLAADSGLSARRLQTMFSRYVGLTPKALIRITRLQRMLVLARSQPSLSWGRIAIECGYYDQAHLVHDARRITGCAPSQLAIREGGLTDTFIDTPG